MEDLLLPPVVARHPVLAAPVHVDGGQVHPELLARLLEQVVGDLLGDGVVHGLGHLVEEAAQVLVRPARPVLVLQTKAIRRFVITLRDRGVNARLA